MANPSASKVDQITGVVKTVTFHNEETGFFVVRIDTEGKGEKTVTGSSPTISVGELLTATGSWSPSKWGPQLKATQVKLELPNGLEGIEKFLANSIEGIGPGTSKKLANFFGENVFHVIENEPEKLRTVPGIGKAKAASIVEGYNERKGLKDIEVFLFKVGLSPKRARRVLQRYGTDAVEKIKSNPYLLCRDVWGIGFTMADTAARKQGIPADSEYRVRAGIQHVLNEAQGQGSCGLPLERVREEASTLLQVDYDLINRCIDYEIEAEELVRDTSGGIECLFAKEVYKTESELARRLLEHAARPVAHVLDDVHGAIIDAELKVGRTLSDLQREAVYAALTSQVCLVTGGPGTGKTTITQVILEVYKAEGFVPIRLAAPTGKAAKRAAEATGFESSTVHRLLEVQRDGGFKYNARNPLEAYVVSLDETSMLDIFLMLAVLRAIPAHARLIIIGDKDQLSSVKEGKVLGDMLDSGVFPTVRLKEVRRTGPGSDINLAAAKVNAGEMPDIGYKQGSDFCFTNISPKNPKSETDKDKARDEIEQEILRLVRDMYKLGHDPIRDVQVLAPMRKGRLGFASLNVKLQEMLNPLPAVQVEWNGGKWGVGDKLMQLRNNYEKGVFNGDIGFISEIDKASQTIVIEFDDEPKVYKFSELDEVTLAYAFSIHKSQGSEFPVVVMPLDTSHFMMLRRSIVYTGMTRAKRLCVIVGQPLALQIALRNEQSDERFTRLKDLLRRGLPREMREAA